MVKEIFFFKELAHAIMETGSLKPVGQDGRLEIQTGSDAAVSRQNFYSRKPQVLLLSPSTDWVRPIYIIRPNVSYIKEAIHHIYKMPSQQHLVSSLIK